MVDNNNNIAFALNPKAGCSHIKNIFAYLAMDIQADEVTSWSGGHIHIQTKKYNKQWIVKKPRHEHTNVVLVARHPYDRLLSGFFDKYKPHGQYRFKWDNLTDDLPLTLNNFIDKLIDRKWKYVDKLHFSLQSRNSKFLRSCKKEQVRAFDIKNIDYNYIGSLYNRTIPDDVINIKQGHEHTVRDSKCIVDVTPDMPLDLYYDKNIDKEKLLTPEVVEKLYKFFYDDFKLFEKYGIFYNYN